MCGEVKNSQILTDSLDWFGANGLAEDRLGASIQPGWTPPRSKMAKQAEHAYLRTSVRVGVIHIIRLPYLRGIFLYLMCYSVLSTFLYSQQIILIPHVMPSFVDRMQLFASVDLGINVLAFPLQFFGTGWVLTRFGVVVMLAVMPMVSLIGCGVFGLSTVLPVLIAFGVLRRAGEFSMTKPTRESLFAVVPQEEKYQAKNLIDTVVHRGADVTGTGIVSLFHRWGMGLSHMAFAAMPIVMLWVGRWHEDIRRNR